MRTLRIGSGAGYSGDRIEPALELAEHGALDYLVFECLAERTIALAQQQRQRDPEAGYDPLLTERMTTVLRACAERKIRVITNMGAANPVAAARQTARIARELGLTGLRIAAVTGDDVTDRLHSVDLPLIEREGRVADIAERMISANAYLGAGPIIDALRGGADVVITGRVGDPAMFTAPLVHEFGWAMDDWTRLGRGTLVGHLLECAGQITGGYFADPGYKDVPDLARLGFPLAEVTEDGHAVITKVAGSGGQVSIATCKEQILYEVHDPARYIQPDVVADFTGATLQQIGPDRVAISGGAGTPRTPTLKVSVGYHDSFIGEGQMSYAGPGALARARLALDIVEQRLKLTNVATTELRFELIGADSVRRGPTLPVNAEPEEVRIRVVGRTATMREAVRIGNEVETLYTNGPAGGGGALKSAREILAVASTLIPREWITPHIAYEVA
ncbi:acyclic terpene utilization AtuA family protein [Acidisphaera sp. L21]|uniref:acyclic terpene utilization AtuA family protein n=1 Tax=Acidisphaera sp. L21 TaxID=1641851 RepID=UPI00131CFFBA|nr:acyclic terpene utilization AtuA family protein [Acidisphaera sp. L21]